MVRLLSLIATLLQIEASAEIIPVGNTGYLTDGEAVHPLVDQACGEADSALITSQGHPNFNAHAELKLSGFEVTRGEYDSFGWLTGVIHTKKGQIVYG